jgi:hypothetical protein
VVKKKSPVVPVTFIIIGIAVAVAVNSRLHPVDPKQAAEDAQKQMLQQQQSSTQMRPADDPNALHQALTQSVEGGDSKFHQAPMKKGMIPGSDPMVAQKQEAQKPKPNPSSTNSGWYMSNSH